MTEQTFAIGNTVEVIDGDYKGAVGLIERLNPNGTYDVEDTSCHLLYKETFSPKQLKELPRGAFTKIADQGWQYLIDPRVMIIYSGEIGEHGDWYSDGTEKQYVLWKSSVSGSTRDVWIGGRFGVTAADLIEFQNFILHRDEPPDIIEQQKRRIAELEQNLRKSDALVVHALRFMASEGYEFILNNQWEIEVTKRPARPT